MRQSKAYVLIFTAVLTVVCAVLLAGAYQGLRERTLLAQAVDKKTKILGAAGLGEGLNSKELDAMYDNMVVPVVLDFKGNPVQGKEVSDVNVEGQYKQFLKDGSVPELYPLYKVRSDVDTSKFDAYIIPVYGNGLWDNIWGYISIGGDYNTITGAIFDHKAETPGLGARITEKGVQSRFVGKKLFNEAGVLVGVQMMKGEKGPGAYADNNHKIDGMAGATMTGNGLNAMLSDYLTAYGTFFKTAQKNTGKTGSSITIPRNFK